MEKKQKIKILRQFFSISVAAFEMQYTISQALGNVGTKSYMHSLHINAKEEIDKENPNLEIVDKYLAMMEDEADKNNLPPKFEKGGD